MKYTCERPLAFWHF